MKRTILTTLLLVACFGVLRMEPVPQPPYPRPPIPEPPAPPGPGPHLSSVAPAVSPRSAVAVAPLLANARHLGDTLES
jgi:hypothetical protein